VPDAIEPILGWRSWFVLRADGVPRLSSVCYWTVWEPRRAVVAQCHGHVAPAERCTCGIYASDSARGAAPFLISASRARVRAVGRVLGLASLWGTVVECERGWRASYAYPFRIYVPTGPHRSRSEPSGHLLGWRPRYTPLPVEEIAEALSEYGVAVELVSSGSVAELAATLDSDPASYGAGRGAAVTTVDR